MLLTESEINEVLAEVKAAFPKLRNWEYNNEINNYHMGFSVWGDWTIDRPEKFMYRRFFVTFNIYKSHWVGYLTIGQPSFFWTDADMGDAHLLNTDNCESLAEAITMLKSQMVEFLQVFSALPAT
ncbi:hypothetical protein [[Phormidium] sp. ETS-05]|uniref:hypothetical protein n=1 Tax=[Phormidium] sp. ETS-05 TaxID=222819 RepID=UPI0018EED2FE|nr:hypothetical protein [[Phormidium] sp. ETS-05]